MRKGRESELDDWGQSEYKRSDLGKIVRGKYAQRLRESTNVVVLEPKIAKAFPNDKAVNDALRGLIGSKKERAPTNSARKAKATMKKRAA